MENQAAAKIGPQNGLPLAFFSLTANFASTSVLFKAKINAAVSGTL
jgi:hypothetical protein